MFRASFGLLFSLLGFLPQLGQIAQGVFGFGSFGHNVEPVQGIALRISAGVQHVWEAPVIGVEQNGDAFDRGAGLFIEGFFWFSIFRPKKKEGEQTLFAKQLGFFLQFEPFLGLHDPLDDLFGQGFAARQPVDGLDHVGVGFPLVLQILGPTVIDVVLFGDLVQTIDAGIAPLQPLLEFGAQPHVLVAGPVKFEVRLGPPFLKVEAARTFFACLGLVGSRHRLA